MRRGAPGEHESFVANCAQESIEGTATFQMRAQKIVDLLVGIGMGQRNGIHKATEVRRSRRGGAYFWAYGRGGDGEATTLTAAGDAKARWIDLRT